MPLYRITPPGETVEAEHVRREDAHTVLTATTLVIGKPREVVVRRVPAGVMVELVDEPGPAHDGTRIRPI